jgi:hypothetical protein
MIMDFLKEEIRGRIKKRIRRNILTRLEEFKEV